MGCQLSLSDRSKLDFLCPIRTLHLSHMDLDRKHSMVDYIQLLDCLNNHLDIYKLVDDSQLHTMQRIRIGMVNHIGH